MKVPLTLYCLVVTKGHTYLNLLLEVAVSMYVSMYDLLLLLGIKR